MLSLWGLPPPPCPPMPPNPSNPGGMPLKNWAPPPGNPPDELKKTGIPPRSRRASRQRPPPRCDCNAAARTPAAPKLPATFIPRSRSRVRSRLVRFARQAARSRAQRDCVQRVRAPARLASAPAHMRLAEARFLGAHCRVHSVRLRQGSEHAQVAGDQHKEAKTCCARMATIASPAALPC